MPTKVPAISARGIRKRYGDQHVLDGLDLSVPSGSVYALLGANGAGKTTAVKILTTLIPFDSGDITVAGHSLRDDPQNVRRRISVTGQYAAVDTLLTGTENLVLLGELNHLGRKGSRHRADELLQQFDLTEFGGKRAGEYSGGMLRRLDIAMSLVAQPEIVFLDEPTTGLDPRSRHEMWSIVRTLTKSGVTIFLTTQYLDEADELADTVGVLNGGRLVAEGTPDELKRLVPGGHVALQFENPAQLDYAATVFPYAHKSPETLTLQIPSDGAVSSIRTILDSIDDPTVTVEKFSVHTPDLDDVFFALTAQSEIASVR
ncbi:ATP-binding cassette domain-containing protein [Rhodococcus sp. OK302]|uniref:ATP-binding cassette domain-containing protein n=1 Tax=Rhodococcus sp. OK302 TaxID=1882769 RepID=UPI000B942473|nr:ATP-binding cassette domain-containing protein [Rhodococcus sp. OK302]OYD68405.1 ABC-2 type transport system ATP-binding protein [Rhodococcus sp. OK302]